MQKNYNKTLTDLYRKLYENEYTINDEKENVIDLSNLEVLLPPPATLNMTNMADQISTIAGIVDFIAQTIVGQNGDPAEMDNIRKVVTKKYMTNIDWNEIDELILQSKTDKVEDTLLKDTQQDTQDTSNGY